MEDYLYEKKKKFEMMKNRQKMKKVNNANGTGNTNTIENEIKLQTRQCEKNILKKYDFKTKKTDLAPLKQKVMLKKRQSTEKNLLLNLDVLNEDYCTNTIYLQEDEFTLNEEDTEANVEVTNSKNIYNNFSVQSSMINNLLSGNFDDIIISKRESSLSFHNPPSYGSSSIEIVSVNDASNSAFNRRQSSNFTVGGPNPNQEKLQKKGSIYSFFQKKSSSFIQSPTALFKKVKSFIQNSTNGEVEVSSDLENNSMHKNRSFSSSTTDSSGMESKKKSKSKSKLNNLKGSSDNISSRPKRTFSLSSFKFKSLKSITSINNNNNSGINENDTEFSNKSQFKHRNSISRGFMKRISLSKLKLGSSKNIEVKLASGNSELHDSDTTLNNDKKNIGKSF